MSTMLYPLCVYCIMYSIDCLYIEKKLVCVQTRSALQRGDYATARAASNSARSFNKISIIVGAVILVFTLFIVVVSQLSWIIPLAIGAYKEDDRKN